MPVGYRPMGRVGRTLVLVRFPIFLSERHICVLSSFVFNTILTTPPWMSLPTPTVIWTRTNFSIRSTNSLSRIFVYRKLFFPVSQCANAGRLPPQPPAKWGNRWHRLACVPFPVFIVATRSESPSTPIFLSKRHICVLSGISLNTIRTTRL